MAYLTTEHTKIIVETALTFLRCKFPVFSELVGETGGVSGGRNRLSGLVVLGALLARIVACRVGSPLVGLLIGFSGVRFAFLGAELLSGSFPVTGVNGMS